MVDSPSRSILSRLDDEEFFDRQLEIDRFSELAQRRNQRVNSNALLLGAARTGKSELLRKCFDRLFNEAGRVAPFHFALRNSHRDLETFSRDFFAELLAQFIAFRRCDPKLLAASEGTIESLAREASPEDHSLVRSALDSFSRASSSGDSRALVRSALRLPVAAAENAGLKPLVMIDNWHLAEGSDLRDELVLTLSSNSPASFVISGLQRAIARMLPAETQLLDSLEVIVLEKLKQGSVERAARRRMDRLGIEAGDSTIELMIQQLDCDCFYARAIIDAAAARGASLKSFVDFERLYVAEMTGGRIARYLDARVSGVAFDLGARRGVLEALALVTEASSPIPIDALADRLSEHSSDSEGLLRKLHDDELLDVSRGFVSSSGDPVLADYVRARYRAEIIGAMRPAAGDALLAEKLKQSHRLMVSRLDRAVRSQVIELLSQFDHQSIPKSLFDEPAFEKRYRGMNRAQIHQALENETERVRLPQILLVNELASGEQLGVRLDLFAATGFEDGLYTDEDEILWLIALINSTEPIDVETLGRIDQQLETASQTTRVRAVRWYISKEGFSAVASERLSSSRAHGSTHSQLDLMEDCLTRLALGEEATAPSSEFELVIPFEDEAELIAARTAEQIARAADFDQEAINQIKTALIEACINAAEHSDSPDKKIYQRFQVDDDRLIITVSNKGKTFGRANGRSTPSIAAPPAKGTRGRGLQIIRALMDEVKFERTDDGARLVMTKYLRRPENS